MQKMTFGAVVAGAIATFTAGAAFANEAAKHGKKAAAPAAGHEAAAPAGAMVKCYSESCSGKLEYKGQKNECGGKTHAMEVPKSACDEKKGLKVAE